MNAPALESPLLNETISAQFLRWVTQQLSMPTVTKIEGTARELCVRAFGSTKHVEYLSTMLSNYYNRKGAVDRRPDPTDPKGRAFIYIVSEKTILERKKPLRWQSERTNTPGGRYGTGQFGAAQPKKLVHDHDDEPITSKTVEVPIKTAIEVTWEAPKMVDDHIRPQDQPVSTGWTDYGYTKTLTPRTMRDILMKMRMLANDADQLVDEFEVSIEKIEREEELAAQRPVDLSRATDEELLAELRRRLEIERSVDNG